MSEPEFVDPKQLRPGPIRNESLPPELLDQITPHHGLDKDVGIPAQVVKPGARHGVARNDHRAFSVIDAVANRRADRRMIGAHPFHAVGEKYLTAVLQAADAVPLIVPALASEFRLEELLDRLDGGPGNELSRAMYGDSTAGRR